MGRLRRGRTPAPLRPRAPQALLDVLRDGPARLERHADTDAASLRVAIVVPQFRRGSGGHSTIAHLVRGLEGRGHRVSLWVQDDEGRLEGHDPGELFRAFFGPVAGPVHASFDAWEPVDVAVATGWQTVPRVLSLPGAAARAYLVQDHEPEFFATSAERLWAEWTYRQGLHAICASRWLAGTVQRLYGATATPFDLGVDHERYHPLPVGRSEQTVLAYARAVTARRAVPLVLLALEELHRRRPAVEIALFGEAREIFTPFPHRALGVLEPDALAGAYNGATVGLCLSLTNPSLVPTEMLACGLPVVDVRSASMLAVFGDQGPIALAEADPLALCDAVERLLDDLVQRADRTRAGLELVQRRTWTGAAAQVEDGLRAALRG
ncbi:MAG TPA: glycosyltransferase family 4 protein [Baekduia sp.]|nr:glycosyltransferase family 4 protein [Baekduia sp.]